MEGLHGMRQGKSHFIHCFREKNTWFEDNEYMRERKYLWISVENDGECSAADTPNPSNPNSIPQWVCLLWLHPDVSQVVVSLPWKLKEKYSIKTFNKNSISIRAAWATDQTYTNVSRSILGKIPWFSFRPCRFLLTTHKPRIFYGKSESNRTRSTSSFTSPGENHLIYTIIRASPEST